MVGKLFTVRKLKKRTNPTTVFKPREYFLPCFLAGNVT